MEYLDGQEVRVGDEILADGYKGEVVYVINTGEGSERYPAGSWDYLKTGMMVEDESVGLIHYPEHYETMVLLKRKDS